MVNAGNVFHQSAFFQTTDRPPQEFWGTPKSPGTVLESGSLLKEETDELTETPVYWCQFLHRHNRPEFRDYIFDKQKTFAAILICAELLWERFTSISVFL